MTKQTFDDIVSKANGCPMIIYGDNMIIFYANVQGSYFLQDDDSIYCFKINTKSGGNLGISQQEAPWEVMVFNYNEVQYVSIFPDRETLATLITGNTLLPNDTLDEIKKAILESPLNKAGSPRGFSASDESVNRFGPTPGISVSLGEQDPYTRKAMEEFNSKNGN